MSEVAQEEKRGPGRPKKQPDNQATLGPDPKLEFEAFRAEYMMNSLGQRLPTDAATQAAEIYQAVNGRHEGRAKEMILKCCALNSGKPMAAHSLITEAEKIWKIIG